MGTCVARAQARAHVDVVTEFTVLCEIPGGPLCRYMIHMHNFSNIHAHDALFRAPCDVSEFYVPVVEMRARHSGRDETAGPSYPRTLKRNPCHTVTATVNSTYNVRYLDNQNYSSSKPWIGLPSGFSWKRFACHEVMRAA